VTRQQRSQWAALAAAACAALCVTSVVAQSQAQGAAASPIDKTQPRIVTTNPPDRPSPPQPQQKQGIEYLAGTWTFSWTGRESPLTAGPRSGTVIYARIGDSPFLDVQTEGTVEGGGAYKESGTAGWNDKSKLLALREHLANGIDVLSVGDWSSPIAVRFDVQPVRVNGQLVQLRRNVSIVSTTSFSVTDEISIDGGAFMRLGTGTFRKK
jgi:hypothetical protein